MVTCSAIIARLAAAIAADADLQAWALACYNRRCTVVTGRDHRLPLSEADYPAVALLPGGYGLGLGASPWAVNLNIQGLLADSATPATTAGGSKVPATERIDELALHLDRIITADIAQTNVLYAVAEIDFDSATGQGVPPTVYVSITAKFEVTRVLGGTVELT